MNLLLAILALLLMVTVHETGHYIVARLCGLEVEEFGIGFGPILYRRGHFHLRLIPFGAYVAIPELESPDRTGGVSPWKKIATLIAGPLANVLFALVLLWLLFSIGFATYPAKVDVVPNMPAERAGIRSGDLVLSIGGHAVVGFTDIPTYMKFFYHGGMVPLLVRHPDGKEERVWVEPALKGGRYVLGVALYYEPVVAKVSGVAVGKVLEGDRIVGIDGHPVDSFYDVWYWAQKAFEAGKKSVVLKLERNGEYLTVAIPISETKDGIDLGIYPPSPMTLMRFSLPRAVGLGFARLWWFTVLFYYGLLFLFTGRVGLKEIAGPVGIVAIMSSVLMPGLALWVRISSFVNMMAIISLALGLTNLLPIPALDGGRLVFAVLEVLGVRVRPEIEEKIHMIGFYALLGLLVLITFKDVWQFFIK